MKRANEILLHPTFVDAHERIIELERTSEFCRHGMEHLLDVARIAYILNLETGAQYDKELIYAAALLHDIGRARQCEDGTPHEIESARLAETILPECGFDVQETAMVVDAISLHRTKNGEKAGFSGFIYRADKLSRYCCNCDGIEKCDWERKNSGIAL